MRTILILASLFHASTGFALSCEESGLQGSAPATTAVDVPVNAELVFSMLGDNLRDLVLVDAGTGAELPYSLTSQTEGLRTVYSVTPDELLSADTDYDLSWRGPSESYTLELTTGAEVDETPSVAPIIDQVVADSVTDEWGTWYRFDVVYAFDTLDSVDPGDRYEVEIADNPDFNDATVRTAYGSPSRFGADPCWSSDGDFVKETDLRQWVRVTAVDMAGNRSEVSSAFMITRQASEPDHMVEWRCGTGISCSAVSVAPGATGVFTLMLAGLTLARRRSL
jgi:hypothetical protein